MTSASNTASLASQRFQQGLRDDDAGHLVVEAQGLLVAVERPNADQYGNGRLAAEFFQERVPVLFAMLADGIGGHRGGEVAAELAVNHIMQSIAKGDGKYSRHLIENAVNEASAALATDPDHGLAHFAFAVAAGREPRLGDALEAARPALDQTNLPGLRMPAEVS